MSSSDEVEQHWRQHSTTEPEIDSAYAGYSWEGAERSVALPNLQISLSWILHSKVEAAEKYKNQLMQNSQVGKGAEQRSAGPRSSLVRASSICYPVALLVDG